MAAGDDLRPGRLGPPPARSNLAGRRPPRIVAAGLGQEVYAVAKGIEKGKTQNKPKLSTKEKQKRKKEKKAARAGG